MHIFTRQWLRGRAEGTKGLVLWRGAIIRITVVLLGATFLCLSLVPLVEAAPKRIIILRHGEKQDSYKLCGIGQLRSLALRDYYLGKGAANSLFPENTGPDAILAITLHSMELVSPAAQSWGIPIQTYTVVPLPGMTKKDETVQLNERTQEAAGDLLANPFWAGKTVVMAWEHDHIAKQALEEAYPNEKVTLRQLLNLDTLSDVPEDWYGGNYDYFWIVDYGNPGSDIPTDFTVVKQVFPAPYGIVPSNDWGTKEKLPWYSLCQH